MLVLNEAGVIGFPVGLKVVVAPFQSTYDEDSQQGHGDYDIFRTLGSLTWAIAALGSWTFQRAAARRLLSKSDTRAHLRFRIREMLVLKEAPVIVPSERKSVAACPQLIYKENVSMRSR